MSIGFTGPRFETTEGESSSAPIVQTMSANGAINPDANVVIITGGDAFSIVDGNTTGHEIALIITGSALGADITISFSPESGTFRSIGDYFDLTGGGTGSDRPCRAVLTWDGTEWFVGNPILASDV